MRWSRADRGDKGLQVNKPIPDNVSVVSARCC